MNSIDLRRLAWMNMQTWVILTWGLYWLVLTWLWLWLDLKMCLTWLGQMTWTLKNAQVAMSTSTSNAYHVTNERHTYFFFQFHKVPSHIFQMILHLTFWIFHIYIFHIYIYIMNSIDLRRLAWMNMQTWVILTWGLYWLVLTWLCVWLDLKMCLTWLGQMWNWLGT